MAEVGERAEQIRELNRMIRITSHYDFFPLTATYSLLGGGGGGSCLLCTHLKVLIC